MNTSRFAAFTQQELEMIVLGFDAIDTNVHCLPQHRAAMYAAITRLRDEAFKAQTAPDTNDGSHFGERRGVRYTPEPGSESAKELAAWYDSRTYTGD